LDCLRKLLPPACLPGGGDERCSQVRLAKVQTPKLKPPLLLQAVLVRCAADYILQLQAQIGRSAASAKKAGQNEQ